MKNISKYLSVALLLLGAACSKTQEGSYYTPNKDDAREIHFIQSSIEKEFPQDTETGIINVEIARAGNKGAYTINLMKKGSNADLFAIPSEVTIPDGKHSVTVPVEVNLKGGSAGANFKTTLYISDREVNPGDEGAQISQYTDKMNISASFELEWETLYRTTEAGEKIPQLATYNYKLYYSGRDSGLEVEKAVGAEIYRVKDWASGVTFRFIRHADNSCTVPAQSIGFFNTNYNEYVYVADMAVYTGNESAYASYPCTFDGKNTFTFYLIYYVTGGYFSQGNETLVFDTDADTTPVVGISFEGVETTTTGFQAPKLTFSPNQYARSYKAAVVAGDLTTDKFVQSEVRQQIIDEKLEAATPVVTFHEENTDVWNVAKGNYTAVALAYDSLNNPCDLYTERFTFDPAGEYAPKVHEFEFYAPDSNPNYSPYNTLIWQMQTANVKSMKYLLANAAVVDYLCEKNNTTFEALTEQQGYTLDEEIVAQINSDEGRGTVFSSMDEGHEYLIGLLMYNAFGDKMFVQKRASTFGYFVEDFDRTKTMDDYLGAFSATANVKIDSKSAGSETFRIDITRVNDRDVLIKGMSNMRDFAPTLSGYYDKDLHLLIVEAQYAGVYENAYATLGFSDGLFIYWGGESMAIGYIGDKLYWDASPYSKNRVNSYSFLLFSQPLANGSTYLGSAAGEKQYSALKMTPLKLAPVQAAGAKQAGAQTSLIEIGGRSVETYLVGDAVIRPAKASSGTAAVPATATEGKRVRSDLTLHTR